MGCPVAVGLPASGGAEGDQGFSSDRSRESSSDLRTLKGAATQRMKVVVPIVPLPTLHEQPGDSLRDIIGHQRQGLKLGGLLVFTDEHVGLAFDLG
jgi:hypothetical protein